jgi:glycosyltransferase involved in cell wall biosynthesis
MKILFLSQGLPFPVYKDGLTLRVYHLLNEFSKRAKCHMISFSEYPLTEEQIDTLSTITEYNLIEKKETPNLIGITQKILSCKRFFSKQFEKQIKNCLKTFKPDVVMAEQTFMAQYADTIKNTPKVISAVDAISLAAIRQSQIYKSVFKRILWRYIAYQRLRIEKKYFKEYDRITVVADCDAQFLRKKLNKNIHVIPNGVDTQYFTPSKKNLNRKAIVFTGNLSAPMNEESCLYLLNSIFPILNRKYKDINLVIAGRKPTEKILQAAQPYVIIKKDLPDIRDALADAMICVSPVIYGTGIKNNVLQAMAMGIPVMTTALIANPIGIKNYENGFIAERGDTFLSLLIKIIENPSLLDRIGINGRLHVEKYFSWEYVASCYLNMFSEIIFSKKGLKC